MQVSYLLATVAVQGTREDSILATMRWYSGGLYVLSIPSRLTPLLHFADTDKRGFRHRGPDQ